jgi:endonuclease VIII
MPEGDTIHSAARRIGAALVGREIRQIELPQPRHALDRWPERLAGRGVRAVDAHGKHLFLRFDGDLTLHSHLRMRGRWSVYRRGERWRRSAARAWLVIRTDEHEVVQFDGPVLELMTDARTRFDQRLAALGPDLLADDFDERAFLRRLRADGPTRGIGDAGPRPPMQVFERHGRPCRRCGTTIRARGQGDDNRTTYWCPTCQS